MRAEWFTWFDELERNQQVFGIGDDFKFDNDPKLVKAGWLEWHNSGYRHKPNKDEIVLRDPVWDSDLDLAENMFRLKHNTSLEMGVLRARNAANSETLAIHRDMPTKE